MNYIHNGSYQHSQMEETKLRMVKMADTKYLYKRYSSPLCENGPAVFKYATSQGPQFLIPVFRLVGGKMGK